MLLMLRVMLVLMLPGAALAQDFRPAETPPADFSSRQYIDSRGCVFLRDDDTGGWKARLSRDGAAICGYPPTLSARGLDGKPRLRALDPNAGRPRAELLEEALTQTVLTNLRPGELTSDPNPMEKLPDMGPEPSSPAPKLALQAALVAAPGVRRSMGAALQPNKRLCELLGYDGRPNPNGVGADPSQGYCDSLPASDLSRLSFVRPVASIQEGDAPAATSSPAAPPAPAASSKSAVANAQPEAKPAKAEPAKQPALPVAKMADDAAKAKSAPASKPAAPAAGKAPAVAKAAPSASAPALSAGPGLIPAGARYVQVGTYADAANADRVAQAVSRMGYTVLRGKDMVGGREVQFIMAGAFNDRQTIVKALDQIRRAGFKDAYPR
ncbi:MAG: SPOR domain-containing protein [Paracoccus sp. (in: a-proteobacteria)]